jgi:hypothetical protein
MQQLQQLTQRLNALDEQSAVPSVFAAQRG